MYNNFGTRGAEGARVASVLNLIAGLWLIITPFWLGYWHNPAALWDSLVIGIVVGVLAIVRAVDPTRNVGLSWINLILGLWMIVSPFLLPFTSMSLPVRNDVIVGIVIALLSLWSALATPGWNEWGTPSGAPRP